jgi:DNA replication protein DnaC
MRSRESVKEFRFRFESRTAVCAEHGEFESWHTDGGGSIGDWWTSCPECDRQKQLKQAELQKREDRARFIEMCVRDTRLPIRFRGKTLDNYKAQSDGERRALSMARDYVERFEEHKTAGRCLVFSGKVGTGKTHLACAIAGAVARLGRAVLYQTAAGLIRQIRATWGSGDDTTVLRELQARDLLIIDEVGLGYGTDAEILQLSELIDLRYGAVKPTIVITNCSPKELPKYLGDRAVDRLRENGGKGVIFDWDSHRGLSDGTAQK